MINLQSVRLKEALCQSQASLSPLLPVTDAPGGFTEGTVKCRVLVKLRAPLCCDTLLLLDLTSRRVSSAITADQWLTK